MLSRLFNRTGILERSLDAAWLRNETIAQNIANVDTPGYKRKTVSFEEQLQEALGDRRSEGMKTDTSHMSAGKTGVNEVSAAVKQDNTMLSTRLDGNNVDIDYEMAEMAKNTIKYNVLTQKLSSYFSNLKNVINEGRR